MKIIIIVLFLFLGINTINAAHSVSYEMDGGQEIVNSDGETVCGYAKVTTEENDGFLVAIRCSGEGILLCEAWGPFVNSINGNLERELSNECALQILNGTLNSSYNKNIIIGNTTWYGTIIWTTDANTGVSHAICNQVKVVAPR